MESLPSMARTRSHAISTGNCILLILWLTVFVHAWSSASTLPHGYTNAIGFSWLCGDDVTDDGTGPQPSSSCTKAGWCCMQLTAFWSSGMLTGLMKNLVGPCLMFCASGAILNWMRWTRACDARRLWLNISRSLLGAYKLQRKSGPTSLRPMEMTQALWACFLPGMLYLTVLSQCIRVLGCNVSQATRRCLPLQHAILCPLLTFSYKHQAVCTVWLTARRCLFRRAQAWIAGLTGRLGLLLASARQPDLRADMVERGPGGGDSSSGEYVNVRLDSEAEGDEGHQEPRPEPAGPVGHEDQAATAAGPAALTPTPRVRVIYDRLGQVVREPPDHHRLLSPWMQQRTTTASPLSTMWTRRLRTLRTMRRRCFRMRWSRSSDMCPWRCQMLSAKSYDAMATAVLNSMCSASLLLPGKRRRDSSCKLSP